MYNYGSLDKNIQKVMYNTSRDIIRSFSSVASEDPVVTDKQFSCFII